MRVSTKTGGIDSAAVALLLASFAPFPAVFTLSQERFPAEFGAAASGSPLIVVAAALLASVVVLVLLELALPLFPGASDDEPMSLPQPQQHCRAISFACANISVLQRQQKRGYTNNKYMSGFAAKFPFVFGRYALISN